MIVWGKKNKQQLSLKILEEAVVCGELQDSRCLVTNEKQTLSGEK